MPLKIAIYDPYLNTLGGGERYCLTLGSVLSSVNSVDLFWSGSSDILSKAEKRFAINISKINIVPDIFGLTFLSKQKNGIFSKITHLIKVFLVTKSYDYFFYLSDGSIPFLFSKNNFLHVQVPFLPDTQSWNRYLAFIKLKFIRKVICNSQFTKIYSTKIYGIKRCLVLYPPVDTFSFNNRTKKENIILSVGRFDNLLNSKKQDILIEVFKKLSENKHLHGWKLVLAGSSLQDPNENNYLKHLKYLSQNYQIEFVVNPDFQLLKKYYETASIYWHAAGYDVDEKKSPEFTEHFGISVVEAMSSGQVPLVISKGGLPEIVTDNFNGFLWKDQNELISKTILLINSPKILSRLREEAIRSSFRFSLESFSKNIFLLFK